MSQSIYELTSIAAAWASPWHARSRRRALIDALTFRIAAYMGAPFSVQILQELIMRNVVDSALVPFLPDTSAHALVKTTLAWIVPGVGGDCT